MRSVFKIVFALAAVVFSAQGAEPAVPPEGQTPFDPKPLMAKVVERVQSDKFRFAVLGDVKHATNFPGLVKLLEEEIKPDFVLTTGDMVQGGGGKIGPGYWEKLAMDNGDLMRKIPWWPAIGNHEIAGAPITKLSELNDEDLLKQNQQSGIENFKKFYNLDRDYYSFGLRNSVFIALPFKYPKDASEKWLEDELKKASAEGKHIFVFNHCPFYTIGGKTKAEVPNAETKITKLFEKYGVKAVFSGHDHGYYRTVRNGIPYVISAGGGAKLYPCKRVDEALKEDVYYFQEPNTAKGDPLPDGVKVETLPPMEVKLPPSAVADAKKKAQEKPKTDDTKPQTAPSKKAYYLFHNGATGQPDRITDQPDLFTVVIDVDGKNVKMWTITARGYNMDSLQLAK